MLMRGVDGKGPLTCADWLRLQSKSAYPYTDGKENSKKIFAKQNCNVFDKALHPTHKASRHRLYSSSSVIFVSSMPLLTMRLKVASRHNVQQFKIGLNHFFPSLARCIGTVVQIDEGQSRQEESHWCCLMNLGLSKSGARAFNTFECNYHIIAFP
jgi:hypothetical protein